METKNILISGASIAGPAAAYWLTKYGFNVTVVERAPALREGGYKIDIRGAATDVIMRMGLHGQVRQHDTNMLGASFVNTKGKTKATLDAKTFGFREENDVEIMRGDLSSIIYEATKDDVEYLFDDSITAISENGSGVTVDFKNSETRSFDLVIGADGMHSNVRNIVFGKNPDFISPLGFMACIFTVPNFLQLDRQEMIYATPGKAINVYNTPQSKEAKALFLFRPENEDQLTRNVNEQKKIMHRLFANTGWESDRLLSLMEKADDFYFDSVSQVNMKQLHSGRTVLLGDAGYCPSLASGQGTSLALVGAYVLAGELGTCNGNIQQAFENYEREMSVYIAKNIALGKENVKQMVPDSAWKLRLQLFMLNSLKYVPWKNAIVEKIGAAVQDAANAIQLKTYQVAEPVAFDYQA